MACPIVRCAIYTRKSTEDGLDQDFNSLDAQREACEAYIASQRHEGWRLHPEQYDDGGVSGATLEREAVTRLFDDIDAGVIDMVVVYKIDRLTRSLADFAKIVERLDAAKASFVSVTQAFNTSTSMGRLTLNVLLSFAQFEREVTAERIRDKIAASKKKGLWTGGSVPFGYSAIDRKLEINKAEAAVIVKIFDAYARGKTVREIARSLALSGVRTKVRSSGRGGAAFARGAIYKILANPIYIGKVRHREQLYEGEHEAIIDETLWTKVAALLKAAPQRRFQNANAPSPLAGKVYANGELLTPAHTKRHGRRYRYYVSRALHLDGPRHSPGVRIPASELETVVARLIRDKAHYEARDRSSDRAPSADTHLSDYQLVCAWRERIDRLSLNESLLRLRLNLCDPRNAPCDEEKQLIDLETPFKLIRRGGRRKIIPAESTQQISKDPALITFVLKVTAWRRKALIDGRQLKELAAEDGVDKTDTAKFFKLAFLAPDIALAIIEGKQPPALTLEKLKRTKNLPIAWADQRALLGFPHPNTDA